jgi:cobalamin biosynthesis protein CobW
MILSKIPATIVTGFLGSGKTTLLSSVLKQAAGKRIAIIVNEFGELDIDGDLLKNCPLDCDDTSEVNGDRGIYELVNGCICCTVEEEFLPVMQELVKRGDDIDHILIETSGLALPKPLVQAFNWPEIKRHCTVDAVITVVDGPAVAAGRFADDIEKVQVQRLADAGLDHDPSLKELLHDQLSAADLVVVSKNDLLTDVQRKRVQSVIKTVVPDTVKSINVDNGEVAIDVLIGIEAGAEQHIDHVHNHHDQHHEHGEHHEHVHDHFDSFVISLGQVDADRLQQKVKELIAKYSILRVKGFVAIPGKPMRQVLQAVGGRLDVHFDRHWGENEERATRLVFIGKELPSHELSEYLKQAHV